MGVNKTARNVMEFIKKYRFVILILVAGVVLMLLPDFGFSKKTSESVLPITTPSISAAEELESILCHIDGAGKTKVMMSYSRGEEIIYQTDQDISVSDTEETEKIKTVIITDGNKTQTGLVSRVDPAKCMGVIVLCQGADRASVRLAIMDAVSKVTGLGADSISVLKMK